MRVMDSGDHTATDVDPLGFLPCQHRNVTIHITDSESMGDDVLECSRCGYTVVLRDLYLPLFPDAQAA